jgi:hypothetical protein
MSRATLYITPRRKRPKLPGIGLSRRRAVPPIGAGDDALSRELDAMAESVIRSETICEACGHPGAMHKGRKVDAELGRLHQIREDRKAVPS